MRGEGRREGGRGSVREGEKEESERERANNQLRTVRMVSDFVPVVFGETWAIIKIL